MKRLLGIAGACLLVVGGALIARGADAKKYAATEPSTQPYPLWDGKETPTQYAKRAKIKLAEQKIDLGKGISIRMTLIPAGKFKMGVDDAEAAAAKLLMHNGAGNPADEQPQHEVTITKPFYMSLSPLTQEQSVALGGKPDARAVGPKLPTCMLDYDDALAMCKTISTKAGMTVRLPTEAEYEYACRAGTTTAYNTGPFISSDWANYEGASTPFGGGKKGITRGQIIAAGSFKPNAWGLYDMHGNVAVWCSDWYSPDYYAKSPAEDPTGPDSGQRRVVRSAGCVVPAVHQRSAHRDCVPPGTVGIAVRLVMELP